MSESERRRSVVEIKTRSALSNETIDRWLEKSLIPAHRVGRLSKFRLQDVDQCVIDGGATLRTYKTSRDHHGEAN
ncbi:MAG: excisionase [Proteobacteria bacterium]|nr:MAG: excisionase [Pseudomonadota bacterium]